MNHGDTASPSPSSKSENSNAWRGHVRERTTCRRTLISTEGSSGEQVRGNPYVRRNYPMQKKSKRGGRELNQVGPLTFVVLGP